MIYETLIKFIDLSYSSRFELYLCIGFMSIARKKCCPRSNILIGKTINIIEYSHLYHKVKKNRLIEFANDSKTNKKKCFCLYGIF